MYENGLFIFRRDFRIYDNSGLNVIGKKCKNVYTVFIFTPEQISNNKYGSDNAIQFMVESLMDLDKHIKKKKGGIMYFYGKNEEVVEKLIDELNIDYICYNKDYTIYALQRDKSINKLCKKKDVTVEEIDDYYLLPLKTVKNASGGIYQKFTPFYNNALNYTINDAYTYKKISFKKAKIKNALSYEDIKKFYIMNENIIYHGGRKVVMDKMKTVEKIIKQYEKTRNVLSTNTSELSAYIKFGCISIREIYHKFKNNEAFIRQLYWRDFYSNVMYEYPNVLKHGMRYENMNWNNNMNWFKKWCDGKTGYPIVDAGMRQLNITGYMHNRARLIVSSFLVKILGISWKKGEQYFSSKLVDYDPSINNGNWNWVAGTGTDTQPWFRIFNPVLQTKNFDPECIYIKKWIPELFDLSAKEILNWTVHYDQYNHINYPPPMVDYNTQKKIILNMYSSAN